MRSATAQIDIGASPVILWAALTSAEQTPMFFSGLRLVSAWQPDVTVDAYYRATHIATGSVVLADAPRLLVYRLEDPVTAEVDCWISWHLQAHDTDITRVRLTVDTLPIDPPVDSVRLLSNLKTYLETSSPLTVNTASGRPPGRAGRIVPATDI
jgi:uncharacterized protein YndB with AHSA1/START domain